MSRLLRHSLDSNRNKNSLQKRRRRGPDRSLQNDYPDAQASHQLHAPAHQAQVPACHRFITPADKGWWDDNLARFSEIYTPCNTIEAECIKPFPKCTKETLIAQFCPHNIVGQILPSKADEASSDRIWVEELGISSDYIDGYAKAIAEALAAMHWIGRMDGNDIEFVLAPPPARAPDLLWRNPLGFRTVWMLDFDLVRDMAMDEDGVRQAVVVFCKNDPYCLRPGKGDMWTVFQEQHLRTSEDCIISLNPEDRDERLRLSKLFIGKVEGTQTSGGPLVKML
ncbi:hypothetical protein BBP40_009726 [Aspergillus hancockii]|nr:hypothetical protein BBP40_009726 [Aspergillus hancockii]